MQWALYDYPLFKKKKFHISDPVYSDLCRLHLPGFRSRCPEKNLVIGLLPEMNIFKQKERFELLAAYLSKHLKIEVRLKMLSYDNIIESNTNLHMIG